jgi:hypothetical protein
MNNTTHRQQEMTLITRHCGTKPNGDIDASPRSRRPWAICCVAPLFVTMLSLGCDSRPTTDAGDAARDAGDAMEDSARDAADAVEDSADSAGSAVQGAAREVGE